MSNYEKYKYYKNKYLGLKKVIGEKRIRGGNECLKHTDGSKFANILNKSDKNKAEIKLYPDDTGAKSYRSYMGYQQQKLKEL